jgi:hypothetical protein
VQWRPARLVLRRRAGVAGRLLLLVAVLLTLLVPAIAHADGTTFYVSLDGNDRNSGTSPSRPWRTPDRVSAQQYRPGDRILFEGGKTFKGGLRFDGGSRGTAEAPISIGSYGIGQEQVGGREVGIVADPLLASPGGGGTIGNPDLLGTLSAYQLQEGSPALDAGIDLAAELGVAVAPSDFFGSAVPQHGGYDIGASELQGQVSALNGSSPADATRAP